MTPIPGGPTGPREDDGPRGARAVAALLFAAHIAFGLFHTLCFAVAAQAYPGGPAIPVMAAKPLIAFALAWLYWVGLRMMGALTWTILAILSFLTCLAGLVLGDSPDAYLTVLLLNGIPFLMTLYCLSEALRLEKAPPAPRPVEGPPMPQEEWVPTLTAWTLATAAPCLLLRSNRGIGYLPAVAGAFVLAACL